MGVDEDFDRLDSMIDELAATPTVAEFKEEQHKRIRGQKILLALLFLVVIGGYIFTYVVAQDVGRTSARAEILDSTVSSLVAANAEREARGLPAIPIEDVVRQLNDKGIVQAVTSAVLSQIESDPRFRGPQGVAGPDGAAGTPGIGLPGVDGIPGQDGPQGKEGPQGVAGATGAQGIQGTQGPEGKEGAQGPEGVAGPAPASFTINGQTCTRDADNSGNYTCVIGP